MRTTVGRRRAGGRGPDTAPERWIVVPVRTTTAADGWRGIEARDVDLVPHPEAIATALAPVAAIVGAQLVLEQPVDGGWRAGVDRAAAQLASWHDATSARPLVVAPRSRSVRPNRRRGPDGVAQCFTGGVDSFFALRHGEPPTHLVYVVGFDVDLDDTARAADQIATLEAVAADGGQQPLALRSDLRSHPHSARVTWGWQHGGALAGIGHALAGEVGALVIPPSYPEGRLIPFGSHPHLDPLWSRPDLAIRHSSTTKPRVERLRALADDPLVHAHLHVCWEHRTTAANCGLCEKCLRTTVMLAGLGVLDRCRTMPAIDDVPAAIAALGSMDEIHRIMWGDTLGLPLPPAVHDAIRTVLAAPIAPSEGA